MPDSCPILPYDPNRLFDVLSAWSGVTGDKMLARVLQLSPALIHRMRAGHLPIRASILAAMADAAGKSIDELRQVLGDRRKKMRMPCSAPCRLRITQLEPCVVSDTA